MTDMGVQSPGFSLGREVADPGLLNSPLAQLVADNRARRTAEALAEALAGVAAKVLAEV
jgi:hypothetical protein